MVVAKAKGPEKKGTTKAQRFFRACLSCARQTKASFVPWCLCGSRLLSFLRQSALRERWRYFPTVIAFQQLANTVLPLCCTTSNWMVFDSCLAADVIQCDNKFGFWRCPEVGDYPLFLIVLV